MTKKILLKCLIKNSKTYNVIKELKSNDGELDFNELKNKLEINKHNLDNLINSLYPSITQNDSSVSIDKEYDFLLVGRKSDISFYNWKIMKQEGTRRNSKKVPLELRYSEAHERLIKKT